MSYNILFIGFQKGVPRYDPQPLPHASGHMSMEQMLLNFEEMGYKIPAEYNKYLNRDPLPEGYVPIHGSAFVLPYNI